MNKAEAEQIIDIYEQKREEQLGHLIWSNVHMMMMFVVGLIVGVVLVWAVFTW